MLSPQRGAGKKKLHNRLDPRMIFTETRSAIFAPLWPTMYLNHTLSSTPLSLNKGFKNTEGYAGMC